jgi:hypothetical protein
VGGSSRFCCTIEPMGDGALKVFKRNNWTAHNYQGVLGLQQTGYLQFDAF